jgi:hypothetical protein
VEAEIRSREDRVAGLSEHAGSALWPLAGAVKGGRRDALHGGTTAPGAGAGGNPTISGGAEKYHSPITYAGDRYEGGRKKIVNVPTVALLSLPFRRQRRLARETEPVRAEGLVIASFLSRGQASSSTSSVAGMSPRVEVPCVQLAYRPKRVWATKYSSRRRAAPVAGRSRGDAGGAKGCDSVLRAPGGVSGASIAALVTPFRLGLRAPLAWVVAADGGCGRGGDRAGIGGSGEGAAPDGDGWFSWRRRDGGRGEGEALRGVAGWGRCEVMDIGICETAEDEGFRAMREWGGGMICLLSEGLARVSLCERKGLVCVGKSW